LTRVNSTIAPENSAPRKRAWPPENLAPVKSTSPPENLAPWKSHPSKTTPVKSNFRPCHETADPGRRWAPMSRMMVWAQGLRT